MSLNFALVLKADAGQAKAELRNVQAEVTKTGAAAKVLATEAKGAGAGLDMLGADARGAATGLDAISEASTEPSTPARRAARRHSAVSASIPLIITERIILMDDASPT